MFERYTEKARRSIFFARYEASQFGSSYIETEHLLLGVLRESPELLRLFGDRLSTDQIRARINELVLVREHVSTSVDLPLSNECKRVLAYAAEEAERMSHKHIGTEHLFLGLLREEKSLAASLLNDRGVTLKEAREKIAANAVRPAPEPMQTVASQGISKVHGAAWRTDYLSSIVGQYQNFMWQKQPWKARDILVEKQTGHVMFYRGQEFDPVRFTLTRGGWTRDHCAICNWPLYESDDQEHGIGYTNGRDWICTECHDKFFAPPVTPPPDDFYT